MFNLDQIILKWENDETFKILTIFVTISCAELIVLTLLTARQNTELVQIFTKVWIEKHDNAKNWPNIKSSISNNQVVLMVGETLCTLGLSLTTFCWAIIDYWLLISNHSCVKQYHCNLQTILCHRLHNNNMTI